MLLTTPSATTRQHLAALALLWVTYTATGVFSLQFATIQGAGAAIWIPAGVGIAGLFLGGIRLWPAILIGRLAAGALTGSEQPVWAEALIAVSNAATSVLAVWLVMGRSGGVPVLNTLVGMMRFIVGGVMVPAALAGVVGTATLYLSSGIAPETLPATWLRWAAGNATSTLVLVPLILSLREPFPAPQRWHFALLLATTCGAAAVIFLFEDAPWLSNWHIYPILIWAALAFSVRGAAATLLILEAVAVIGILLGRGPMVSLSGDPQWALISLHQFLAVTAVTVLLLAAVADERRGKAALEKAQEALRQLNAGLESRVQERTQALRRSEEALLQARKMEAIGQLTGGVAHDFNNLLQTISGSLELIARQPESPSVPRWLETAKRATTSGTRLTSQLLAFARMQQLELKPIAVTSLVTAMGDLLRSTVGAKVRLELAIEPAQGLHVLSDRTQLELMILNLVVNARDAMPQGGGLVIGAQPVTVQGEPDLADGRYVRLFVRDTGQGMAPEVAARAFDPFFTTKGIGKGTGLGLSMVYGVAKQSGGVARITTRPGEGTTVAVLLPCVDAPSRERSVDSGASQPADFRLAVLLVDDDDGVRETTASMLEVLGMEVGQAASGPEALARMDTAMPDLVVLDYAMPDMNGAEVARTLRTRGVAVPILMVTGNADPDEVRASLGPDGSLLPKPFQLDDLAGAILATGVQPKQRRAP